MTVQSLYLSNNHFNDDDAERIVKILSNNTVLQRLDFVNNKITTRGAIAISEYLQHSVALKQLKLSWRNLFIRFSNQFLTKKSKRY